MEHLMKLTDAKKDHYRKLAKQKGYRSRSAYKLTQLNNSYHIFNRGDKVIDFGCAPGGWLQIAGKIVGMRGTVIGIDIKQVEPIENTIILQDDIENQLIVKRILKVLGGKADVVLSDLSPNVSGIWDIDHIRQISLSKSALNLSRDLLKKGGSAVFKVFEENYLNDFKNELKIYFHKIFLNKPDASRQSSSEFYFVCLNFKS